MFTFDDEGEIERSTGESAGPGGAGPGGPTNASIDTVPGGNEVWRIGGITHLVWIVDGFDPPLYMAWAVTEDQFADVFEGGTPRYSQPPMTWDDANRIGVITHGNVANIDNTAKHPFETFVRDFEREAQIRPWLTDPEMLAIHVAAVLEGRLVTDAEIQTTNWWKTHSAAERAWLGLNASDPAEALRQVDDRRRIVRDTMVKAGIDNPDSALIQAIADRVTTGEWTDSFGTEQLIKLSDPYAPGTLDPALEALANDFGIDITRAEENTVRESLNLWLGPKFGEKSPAWVERWAGELRNNPDAEQELTRALQGTRMALFPEYTNENLTYEDIAGPVRQQFQQIWGEEPDEDDPLFFDIAQDSNIRARGSRLRLEGLNRGNKQVNDDFQSSILGSFGGQIRRAV
jgi:hypothetical protein